MENEDYDKAKLKKVYMDEYRLQVYKDLHVHDLLEMAGVSVLLLNYVPYWSTCIFHSCTNNLESTPITIKYSETITTFRR